MATPESAPTDLQNQRAPSRSRRAVLILAVAFPPDNLSGAKRPFRFATYLPQHGYETQVITACRESGSLKWDHVHVAPAVEGYSRKAAWSSWLLEQFQRRLLPYNDQLPWVPYALETATSIVRRSSVAAVLSTSPPICSHLVAARLKSRYGVKWIADFRDPLYGNPWRRRRLAWIYDALLERYIIRRADAVLANTSTVGDMLRNRYPSDGHKIHVLWNGYDPADVLEAAPIPQRDYQTLAHVGVLGGGRHPGLLLDAVERLIGQGQLAPAKLRIQLIGSMDCDESWAKRPSFHSLTGRGCLEYTGRSVPEAEAHRLMAQSDFLLLLDLNDINARLQVPAKLFDYLRIGRPILAFTSSGSPAEHILAKSAIPHVCLHPDDPPEHIERMVGEFLQLRTEPVVASSWFWKTFNASTQAESLSRLLDSLLEA